MMHLHKFISIKKTSSGILFLMENNKGLSWLYRLAQLEARLESNQKCEKCVSAISQALTAIGGMEK